MGEITDMKAKIKSERRIADMGTGAILGHLVHRHRVYLLSASNVVTLLVLVAVWIKH